MAWSSHNLATPPKLTNLVWNCSGFTSELSAPPNSPFLYVGRHWNSQAVLTLFTECRINFYCSMLKIRKFLRIVLLLGVTNMKNIPPLVKFTFFFLESSKIWRIYECKIMNLGLLCYDSVQYWRWRGTCCICLQGRHRERFYRLSRNT